MRAGLPKELVRELRDAILRHSLTAGSGAQRYILSRGSKTEEGKSSLVGSHGTSVLIGGGGLRVGDCTGGSL